MEVTGQLHDAAGLSLEEHLRLAIRQEAGWASETVWPRWEEKNSLLSGDNRTTVVQTVT
jgi:hypothetical protein